MHVRVYVCMHVYVYIYMYVCMYVWMYVCIYVCMYVCMYVFMYVCIYVWICVCILHIIYIYIYIYICCVSCLVFSVSRACGFVSWSKLRVRVPSVFTSVGPRWNGARCVPHHLCIGCWHAFVAVLHEARGETHDTGNAASPPAFVLCFSLPICVVCFCFVMCV